MYIGEKSRVGKKYQATEDQIPIAITRPPSVLQYPDLPEENLMHMAS